MQNQLYASNDCTFAWKGLVSVLYANQVLRTHRNMLAWQPSTHRPCACSIVFQNHCVIATALMTFTDGGCRDQQPANAVPICHIDELASITALAKLADYQHCELEFSKCLNHASWLVVNHSAGAHSSNKS